MHCRICDCLLTEEELKKKDFDEEFLDICDACEDEEADDEDLEHEIEMVKVKLDALFTSGNW